MMVLPSLVPPSTTNMALSDVFQGWLKKFHHRDLMVKLTRKLGLNSDGSVRILAKALIHVHSGWVVERAFPGPGISLYTPGLAVRRDPPIAHTNRQPDGN